MQAMRRHYIEPDGYNILHYLANENNFECIREALKVEVPYKRDNNNLTPLQYALNRKSHQAVGELLKYVTENDNNVKYM